MALFSLLQAAVYTMACTDGESGHGLVARIFVPVLEYPGEGIATLGEGAEFPLLGSSNELSRAT